CGIENWGKLYLLNYLGEYHNGIYAIVLKFSSIFFVVITIYQQAWQESAIRDYKDVNKNIYFSRFFNYYLLFLAVVALGFAIGMEIFYPLMMSEAYYESVRYIFPQLISLIFMALSFFLGLGYECSYQVKRAIYSAILASLVSLILNYFFITKIGLMGCIVANICAGLSMFIYRIIDVRRYFILKLNKFGILGIIIIVFSIIGWAFYYKSLQ
ncbi:MAG: polysaccharide biosynthesis C-terminal domain-containing protein, partial [Bacteroidales bacterium]